MEKYGINMMTTKHGESPATQRGESPTKLTGTGLDFMKDSAQKNPRKDINVT